MSFKLLAIRPLIGIASKFLKNLEAGRLYSLYNDYSFLNREGKPVNLDDEVVDIKHRPTTPSDLYSIQKINGDVINVHVSAIVGKNGAGKSSLMDLLIYSIFVVSDEFGLVKTENFIGQDPDSSKKIEGDSYNKELKEIDTGLKVEVYYLINDVYYKLRINGGSYTLASHLANNRYDTFHPDKISLKDYGQANNLFYTIVVNYSFYAYNSNYSGIWLKSFFHKNDGYQMPIVINPFRDKGTVNINTETLLTRSRLLSNVLSIGGYKKINNKSSIDKIELLFNDRKDYRFLTNGQPRFTDDFIKQFRDLIIMPLFQKMFHGQASYPKINTSILKYAEIYLINKLITIPKRYQSFHEYDKPRAPIQELVDNYDLTVTGASNYVDELYEDRSHITLKVRQTLNFLREDIYSIPDNRNLRGSFELNSVARQMNSLKRKDWFSESIDYLPPPFFTSSIRFADGSYFEDLSSGEKQKIYSLNSVIYHLKNLESINKNGKRNIKKKVTAYNSINLVFDEVELYYHPQFQKETVASLLNLIRLANLRYINNINIIFLTHSPFILSDIPIQNTVLLNIDKKTGKTKLITKKKQSFGANIHDLLSDNFFLTDSLIGNFADRKIMQLIKKIKEGKWDRSDSGLILKLIGDNFLKHSIQQFKKSNDQDKNRERRTEKD